MRSSSSRNLLYQGVGSTESPAPPGVQGRAQQLEGGRLLPRGAWEGPWRPTPCHAVVPHLLLSAPARLAPRHPPPLLLPPTAPPAGAHPRPRARAGTCSWQPGSAASSCACARGAPRRCARALQAQGTAARHPGESSQPGGPGHTARLPSASAQSCRPRRRRRGALRAARRHRCRPLTAHATVQLPQHPKRPQQLRQLQPRAPHAGLVHLWRSQHHDAGQPSARQEGLGPLQLIHWCRRHTSRGGAPPPSARTWR